MPQSFIVATQSVRAYFREAICSALDHQALHPNQATAAYLVELLCQYAKVHEADLALPLAPVLARAEQSQLAESVLQLKLVGDQSLVVAGFFSDSLKQHQLDPWYYVVLGKKAYHKLSHVLNLRGSQTQLVVVYTELGSDFSSFVRVLTHVKRQSDGAETGPSLHPR